MSLNYQTDAANEVALNLSVALELAATNLFRAAGCVFAAYRDGTTPCRIDLRDAEEVARKVTVSLARYEAEIARLSPALKLVGEG